MTFSEFLSRCRKHGGSSSGTCCPANVTPENGVSFLGVSSLETSSGRLVCGDGGGTLWLPPWRAHLMGRGHGGLLTDSEVAAGAASMRACAAVSSMGVATGDNPWEAAQQELLGVLLLAWSLHSSFSTWLNFARVDLFEHFACFSKQRVFVRFLG
jgi:hypothetical protein